MNVGAERLNWKQRQELKLGANFTYEWAVKIEISNKRANDNAATRNRQTAGLHMSNLSRTTGENGYAGQGQKQHLSSQCHSRLPPQASIYITRQPTSERDTALYSTPPASHDIIEFLPYGIHLAQLQLLKRSISLKNISKHAQPRRESSDSREDVSVILECVI